ncbi:hypothetical protein DFP72DRAFT_889666 [Ephemerocybe angulata]|uniref:DUF6534 domain-containing protein n=1 Tax=Ephemerocybe angulata TaxID=980116 RepID=A0A8H6I3K5_9AGAR|nr:hypothetical protein DFP72DRAFT_889666 [Tulosesus angulatus]
MASNPYILLTGPLLMGSLLSYFLNGAFAMQIYHYYMNYAATDRRFFVYLVAVVVVIELLHMAFSSHTTYSFLAAGYGDPTVFVNAPFSGAALPALNAAGGFCTQIFFAWRILILTKSIFGKIAAGLVALLAGMQCAAGFGVTIQFTLLDGKIEAVKSLNRTIIVWLAGSVSCDILISIAMVFVLIFARSSTAYSSSKNVLNALIIHTIENGMITTVCALVDLICFLVFPDNFYYICFEYLLGRLYANVLLATLNGRQRMRLAATNEHEFSGRSTGQKSLNNTTNQVQLGALRSYPTPTHQTSKTYPVVSVTTDVQIDSDDDGMPKSRMYP